MCELLAVAADTPFTIGDVQVLTDGMERYGMAGFGWGAVWVSDQGTLGRHVSTHAFRDDPAVATLAGTRTAALMIHLRRPSKLSTIGLADAQPFVDPGARFAFSHNGDLAGYRPARRTYAAAGRIAGRADSEVGQRWLEDHWSDAPADACDALVGLHADLGGQANLMALTPDGTTHVYAGNTENPVFRFRLGRLRLVTTALYSIDRSLFQLVAPAATDRHLLRPGARYDLVGGA